MLTLVSMTSLLALRTLAPARSTVRSTPLPCTWHCYAVLTLVSTTSLLSLRTSAPAPTLVHAMPLHLVFQWAMWLGHGFWSKL